MKNLFLSLIILSISLPTFASGIEFFHGSWEEALAKSEEEGKLLFVDVYTEWCGPCKLMAKEVFPLDSVGEFYNANFINFKLDAENGPLTTDELMDRYDLDSYPTYLFIDSTGELQHKSGGLKEAPMFVEVGKQAVGQSLSDEELESKYQVGCRDPDFIQQYLIRTSMMKSGASNEEYANIQKRSAEVASWYFSIRPLQNPVSDRDGAIARACLMGPYRGNPTIEFLVKNYAEYAERAPGTSAARHLTMVNNWTIEELASGGDLSYQKYLADIRGDLAPAYLELSKSDRHEVDPYEKSRLDAAMKYDIAIKGWGTYLQHASELLALYGEKAKWYHWSHVADALIRSNCDDIDSLGKIEKYARTGYEMKKSVDTAQTYGQLLLKLNQTQKARDLLQEALELVGNGRYAEKYREEIKALLSTIQV